MTTPIPSPEQRHAQINISNTTGKSSDEEATIVHQFEPDPHQRLAVQTSRSSGDRDPGRPSPSRSRAYAHQLEDDLTVLQAERVATSSDRKPGEQGGKLSNEIHRSRSRAVEPIDTFDTDTNPVHEKAALYRPPENPTTKIAKFFKYIHSSSFLVRYFTYIVPVVLILLIPLLVGALAKRAQNACVAGVELLWFSVWLEVFWLTLWAGRLAAKLIPYPLGLITSLFTNDSKKWRDLAKQLEIPATLFFWWLGVEISFLPTMNNHHCNGDKTTLHWENTVNKIIVSIFVGTILNFVEKLIIQLIAISFHLRTYADRIELNRFQIGSLVKLYTYSKAKIAMEDSEFEERPSGPASGARTPGMYAEKAQKVAREAFAKVGDVAGTVAGDFVGKKVDKSGHPNQVILTLLNTTSGSQVLARRLYRTFVREGCDTVDSKDLKKAFDNNDEADAAFSMFDKDMNGDISMEELEAVCVEIGRERKSITASLKDLDSVVTKLDHVLFFLVLAITVLVFLSLISTSAAGVLTSAGSAVLALSWLFAATAQEFLQSVVFVFVKHPFDVGDRVSIYGNTGTSLKGDDYFVKEISLLYTEFKKMEGHVVQAPNSYLNSLFILNMRRSGGLAEAIPVVMRFGTTFDQIDGLRQQLLDFVKSEKREYQSNIITELRDITEAYSITLNVVFFYKSNWQNELLRLQRRNKFICAMMVAIQELGIEGPRRNIPGANEALPLHLRYPAAPPTYNATENNASGPPQEYERSPIASPAPVTPIIPPPILRQRGPNATRTHRESLTQMSRRVDFSLGMKDVSSADLMSDVYQDDRSRRYSDVIREANRESAERRIEEEVIGEDGEVREGRSSDSRDRQRRTSNMNPHSGIMRRTTTQSMGGRSSFGSSSDGHRNRFLGRFSRGVPGRSLEVQREGDDMAEQGKSPTVLDPRSGVVSNLATRTDSMMTEPFPAAPTRTHTSEGSGEYEMSRFGLVRSPDK